MRSSRVVITGMGAVSPLGLTVGEMWEGLRSGTCGIGPITAFDPVGFTCKIAGEAPDFDIRKNVPKSHRKATKLMSRDIELSVIDGIELQRFHHISHKAFGMQIDDLGVGLLLPQGIAHSVHEVGSTQTHATVYKQWVVGAAGVFSDLLGGCKS